MVIPFSTIFNITVISPNLRSPDNAVPIFVKCDKFHTQTDDDNDDDDDFQWVRAIKVTMPLGLIDRPFVPHNLISAQESPVPLPKFQMDPRLKILMSSGSKKGTQINFSFFLKKSRQTNPLQVTQRGPYGERYPIIEHFYIPLDISLYLKGTKKRASLHVPQKRGPYLNRRPYQILN
jgi:hypothetical protein